MKTTALVLFAGMLATSAHAEVKITPYGFAQVSYLMTSKAFDVDTKPISVNSDAALTSDESKSLYSTSRGQFMAKHSRFGANIETASNVKAKFEFDLDGDASNTVGATASSTGILRVRQANISLPVGENGTLTAGKKWTIFSPLAPHTAEVTTIQFWAGNTGFLTDGLDYVHKFGDASVAVELQNEGPDNDTVKLSMPAATIRADYKMGDHLLGISALTGKLAYKKQDVTAPISDEDRSVTGTNVYYNGKFMDGAFDLVAEYYMGKHLGAVVTGALATAAKTNASNADIKGDESGYYASLKYKFDQHAVYGGYGLAELKDKDQASGNSKNNLVKNALGRIGYEYGFEGYTLFAEVASVTSSYYEGTDSKDYTGAYYDLGLMARF